MCWYFHHWILFTLSLCSGHITSPILFLPSSLEESLFEDLCSYFSAEYTLDYGEFCKFAKCVSKKKKVLGNYYTIFYKSLQDIFFPTLIGNFQGERITIITLASRWRKEKENLSLDIFPPLKKLGWLNCPAQLYYSNHTNSFLSVA